MSAEPPAPSPFLLEQLARLEDTAPLGPVLDLACGRGRHALACARRGLRGVGVDRDRARLAELTRRGDAGPRPPDTLVADLESGLGIPFRSGSCGAILVFRFLFRPLAPEIARVLAPGGWLLYETFTTRQRELDYGPSNPAFLLEPGELPGLFPELEVVEHAEGLWGEPRPLALARLLARRPAVGAGAGAGVGAG
ncbi:MAG: class I SAM-dependent methyltransferase [Myxococcota bacterium]